MEGNIGVTGERGDERRWTEGNWVIGRSGDRANERLGEWTIFATGSDASKSLVRCSSIDAKIFFEIDSVWSLGRSVLIQS